MSTRTSARDTHSKICWSTNSDPDQPRWFRTVAMFLNLVKESEDFSPAVCIVQNISREEATTIGRHFRVEDDFQQFFLEHTHRKFVMTRQVWNPRHDGKRWRCIDASYPVVKGGKTRISYYRRPPQREDTQDIYFFLVSSLPAFPEDNLPRPRERRGLSRPFLRLAYSTDNVGLTLPYLFEWKCPAFDVIGFLQKAMERRWPRDCLFSETLAGDGSVVQAHPLLYILADFAWARNLRFLDNRVKKVSFENIHKANLDIATVMHGLREDLAYLRAEVGHMLRYTPPDLVEHLDLTHASRSGYRGIETPINSSQRIAEDAKALDKFLTNSLELLMASIALRDSQRAQEDSQRAQMLTVLAAVYVPLSFVTGIFGMNLQELNDSTLPFWMCFEVLGVVLLLTVVMVGMYKLWEKSSEKSKQIQEAKNDVSDSRSLR